VNDATTSYSMWSIPPAGPALSRDEVDLWPISLEVSSFDFARLQRLLSKDEHARALRFGFERDRQQFVVARGFLRVILSSYLDCQPTDLRFKYNEYGKPSLAGPFARSNLNFNLAHSGKLALCGVALDRAIGVDVERILDKFAREQIARRFFSAAEIARVHTLPASDQSKAFFDRWTRKEALIKARGLGLSLAFDQVDPGMCSEEDGLVKTGLHTTERSQWSLIGIDVGPNYSAAVAVEGNDWHPRYRQVSRDMLVHS
jgi:4'-phosphopantetheinyl transferase